MFRLNALEIVLIAVLYSILLKTKLVNAFLIAPSLLILKHAILAISDASTVQAPHS